MIGAILLAIFLVWVFLCAWLAKRIGNLLPNRQWRRKAKVIIFIVLLPTLLIDEVIGGFQFRALCREHALLKVNAERIKGRVVTVQTNPLNQIVDGSVIEILYSRISYKDAETNEELATASSYIARGGRFMKIVGMNPDTPPLVPMTLRDSSNCKGPSISQMAKEYGFVYQQSQREK